MNRLRPDRDALEFLDRPDLDPKELPVCLADLERLNRWFGGARAVLAEVSRVAWRRALKGTVRVLDVGTGGADIPRALVRSGARKGLDVRVCACDRHAQIPRVAAAACAGNTSVAVLRADALALPFRPGQFDFVTCSLMMHHLGEEQAIALLAELREIPRHALIVSDLERGWLAWAGTWLATRLVCRGRFTRHDGPVSVQRAYTLEELRALARRAGCAEMRWRRRAFFRAVGVLET